MLSINNPKFGDYIDYIYPVELEIKDTTDADHQASYLDLDLSYNRDKRLQVKLYDKRDDFNFNIVNFPFLSSNIPQSPAYGVYVSQLIRYARASSAYSDFLVRSRLLTSKLLGQGYNRFNLITTCMAVIMISLGNSNFRSLIWLLTCFLRLLFLRWHDSVTGPFTARTFITYIDILYLCLLQPVYLLLNLTITDFDIFIACGRCH